MVAVVVIALAELLFVMGPALALVIVLAVRKAAREAMAPKETGGRHAAWIPEADRAAQWR
ncbi:hypothetical protein [Nocardia jejuensis]|uniref:hypothetical protein n=1 Tax=Nocardia jejuensis TaxID=328049 RepID=UPI0012FB0D75|nr:hypothetical protein [Nocardia jejuensis]